MHQSCKITLSELIKIQYLVKSLNQKNNPKAKVLSANNLTKTFGRGMEYAESRIYQPGDDVRHIDWRLTARQNKTFTKLYHEEKGENIYVIIDLSNSMYFGTQYALKSVIAAKIAATILWLGFNEHNSIGSIIFNVEKTNFNRARLSKSNILAIINNIVDLHNPELINREKLGENNNFFIAINTFEHLIAKNNKIYIISDFLNLDELLYKKIQKLNFNNQVNLVKISDPIENTLLPLGKYNISNGQDSNILLIDKSNQDFFINYFKIKLANYNKLINKININNLDIIANAGWQQQLIKGLSK